MGFEPAQPNPAAATATTAEQAQDLIDAARYDDLEDVVALFSVGVSLDSTDPQGRTGTSEQQPPQSTMRAAPAVQPCPTGTLEQQPHQSTMRAAPAVQPYPRGTLDQQPPESTMRAAPAVQPCPNISTSAAPSVQHSRCESSHVHVQQSQPRPGIDTRNGDTNRFSHDEYIGREVILYPDMKTNQAVAKGVLFSTDPSSVLAGQALGRQFGQVLVKVVMKRDAVLPRPYVGVEKMADAKDLSIAWPYNWMKLCKTSKEPHKKG